MMLFAGVCCACLLTAALQQAAAVRDSFHVDRVLAGAMEVEQDELRSLAHRTVSQGLAQARGKVTDFQVYDLVQFHDETQNMWILAVVAEVIPADVKIKVVYTEHTAGDRKTFAGRDEVAKLHYVEVDLPDGWETEVWEPGGGEPDGGGTFRGRTVYVRKADGRTVSRQWDPPVPRKKKRTTPVMPSAGKQVYYVDQPCKVLSTDGNWYTAMVIHPQGQVEDKYGKILPRWIRVEYTQGPRYEKSEEMMKSSEGATSAMEKKEQVKNALKHKRKAMNMETQPDRDSISVEDTYVQMSPASEVAQVVLVKGQVVMVLSNRCRRFLRARVIDNAVAPEIIEDQKWYKESEKYQAEGGGGWIAIEYMEGPASQEWKEWTDKGSKRHGPDPRIRYIKPDWNVNIMDVQETTMPLLSQDGEGARPPPPPTPHREVIPKQKQAEPEPQDVTARLRRPLLPVQVGSEVRPRLASEVSKSGALPRGLTRSDQFEMVQNPGGEKVKVHALKSKLMMISSPEKFTRVPEQVLKAFQEWVIKELDNAATDLKRMRETVTDCEESSMKMGYPWPDVVSSILPQLCKLGMQTRLLLEQAAEELAGQQREGVYHQLRQALYRTHSQAEISERAKSAKSVEELMVLVRWCKAQGFSVDMIVKPHVSMGNLVMLCQAETKVEEEQKKELEKVQDELPHGRTAQFVDDGEIGFINEVTDRLAPPKKPVARGHARPTQVGGPHSSSSGGPPSSKDEQEDAEKDDYTVMTPPLQAMEYRAKFDYTAQHSDELSFEKGDIIDIREKQDNGWWIGTRRGGSTEGLVPSNFVEALALEVC